MRNGLIATLFAVVCPFVAQAHDSNSVFRAEEIVFQDNNVFPPGAKSAVLFGDAAKPGLFILQIKFPPNYVLPPHTHPGIETVVMLSGSMGLGEGKAVEKKGSLLPPGSAYVVPKDHVHYVWTGDEGATLQVTVNGPFDIIYVNPQDDPRKK